MPSMRMVSVCRYIYFWAGGFGFWKREEAETKKKKRNLTVVWYRVEEIGTALRTLVGNGLPKASLSWKVLRRNLVSSKQYLSTSCNFFFPSFPRWWWVRSSRRKGREKNKANMSGFFDRIISTISPESTFLPSHGTWCWYTVAVNSAQSTLACNIYYRWFVFFSTFFPSSFLFFTFSWERTSI